jgi:hypothetical protein
MDGEHVSSGATRFALWKAVQQALGRKQRSSNTSLAPTSEEHSSWLANEAFSCRNAVGMEQGPRSVAVGAPALSGSATNTPVARQYQNIPQNTSDTAIVKAYRENHQLELLPSSNGDPDQLVLAGSTPPASSDGQTQEAITTLHERPLQQSATSSAPIEIATVSDHSELFQAVWNDVESLCTELESIAFGFAGYHGRYDAEAARMRWLLLRQRARQGIEGSRMADPETSSVMLEQTVADHAVDSRPGIQLAELVSHFLALSNRPGRESLSKELSSTQAASRKALSAHPPAFCPASVSMSSTETPANRVQSKLFALECGLMLDLLQVTSHPFWDRLFEQDEAVAQFDDESVLLSAYWERWARMQNADVNSGASSMMTDAWPGIIPDLYQRTLAVAGDLTLRLREDGIACMVSLLEQVDLGVFLSLSMEDIPAAVFLLYAINLASRDEQMPFQQKKQIFLRSLQVLVKWQQLLTESWLHHLLELETVFWSLESTMASLMLSLRDRSDAIADLSLWALQDATFMKKVRCIMECVFETNVKALAFHAEHPSRSRHYRRCCHILHLLWASWSRHALAPAKWPANAWLQMPPADLIIMVRSLAAGASLLILRDLEAAQAAESLFLELFRSPWRYRLIEYTACLFAGQSTCPEWNGFLDRARDQRVIRSNTGQESGSLDYMTDLEDAETVGLSKAQPAAEHPETLSRPIPDKGSVSELASEALALGALHCLLRALCHQQLFSAADGYGLASALALRISSSAGLRRNRSLYFTVEITAALCYLLRTSDPTRCLDKQTLSILVDTITSSMENELRSRPNDASSSEAEAQSSRHRIQRALPATDRLESRDDRVLGEVRAVQSAAPTASNRGRQVATGRNVSLTSTVADIVSTRDVTSSLIRAAQCFAESLLNYLDHESVPLLATDQDLVTLLERLAPSLDPCDRFRMLALRERSAQPVFGLETWVDRIQHILTIYLRDEKARAVRMRAVRFLRDTFTTWKGLYADTFVAELIQPVLLAYWKDLQITGTSPACSSDETVRDTELTEELLHTIAVALSAPTTLPVFERLIKELVVLDDATMPVILAALESYLRESQAARASLLLAALTDHWLPHRSWRGASASEIDAAQDDISRQRRLSTFCGFLHRLTKDVPDSPFIQLDGKTLSVLAHINSNQNATEEAGLMMGLNGDPNTNLLQEEKPLGTRSAEELEDQPRDSIPVSVDDRKLLAPGMQSVAPEDMVIENRPFIDLPVATWFDRLLELVVDSVPTRTGTGLGTWAPLDLVSSSLLHLAMDPGFGHVALLPSLNVSERILQWLERTRVSSASPSLAGRTLVFEVLWTVHLRCDSVAPNHRHRFDRLVQQALAELCWQADCLEQLTIHPPWLDFVLRLIVHGWCSTTNGPGDEGLLALTSAFLITLQTCGEALAASFLHSQGTNHQDAFELAEPLKNAAAILENLHGLALCFRELLLDTKPDKLEALPILSGHVTATDGGVEMFMPSDSSATGSGDDSLTSAGTRSSRTFLDVALGVITSMAPIWAWGDAAAQSPVVVSQRVRLRRLAMAAWCNWVTLTSEVGSVHSHLQLLEGLCRKFSTEWFGQIAAEFTTCYGAQLHLDRGPNYLLDRSVQQAQSLETWAVVASGSLPVIVTADMDGDHLLLAIRRVTGSHCVQLLLRQPPWTWYPWCVSRAPHALPPAGRPTDTTPARRVEGNAPVSTPVQTSLPSSCLPLTESESGTTFPQTDLQQSIHRPCERTRGVTNELVGSLESVTGVSGVREPCLRGIMALLMHRQPLEEWRRLADDRRVWQVLDRMPPEDIHRIGLVYVGPGQERESEILANAAGDMLYQAFGSSLGCFMPLTETWMFAYTGGLDYSERQADGALALYYRDAATQVIFHTTTLMPSAHFPRSASDEVSDSLGTSVADERLRGERGTELKSIIRKKRHVGNDHVKIFWCARREQTRAAAAPDILPGAFNSVHFTVAPMPLPDTDEELAHRNLLHVQAHWHRNEIPRCGPFRAPASYLLGDTRSAGFLLRLSAVHANILCGCCGMSGRRGGTSFSSTVSGSMMAASASSSSALIIEQEPWLRRLHYMRQQIERLSA